MVEEVGERLPPLSALVNPSIEKRFRMHSSPFNVAGMSSSTSSHHNPNLNAWGSTSTTTPFGESLSQSRSHYQSGYLMSASQSNSSPQGNQRVDEVPVVQTKAKLNQVLTRGSASDFGMDSMFQSSRQRQNLADEDAPPMSSVNDIPNEVVLETNTPRFQPRHSTNFESSQFSRRHTRVPSAPPTAQQPLYIIVYGYPADKYSVTVEYFKSLGESTEADPNTEILNCFRIGYREPADAMRAVRKSGEVLGGSWMVGAKWADPGQAEALLGQPVLRNNGATEPNNSTSPSNAMAVDDTFQSPVVSNSGTPNVGTPIRLEPSISAFRKPVTSKPATPQAQRGWGTSANGGGGGAGGPANQSQSNTVPPPIQASPSKSVLGQVSDLIFGW